MLYSLKKLCPNPHVSKPRRLESYTEADLTCGPLLTLLSANVCTCLCYSNQDNSKKSFAIDKIRETNTHTYTKGEKA